MLFVGDVVKDPRNSPAVYYRVTAVGSDGLLVDLTAGAGNDLYAMHAKDYVVVSRGDAFREWSARRVDEFFSDVGALVDELLSCGAYLLYEDSISVDKIKGAVTEHG